MNTNKLFQRRIRLSALLLALLLMPLLGDDESHQKLSAPGFRPQSELAMSFLAQLDSSRISVLPTLVRTRKGTAHSEASQKAIVGFLKEHKLGLPEMRAAKLDVGAPQGRGQFSLFQSDLEKIGNVVKKLSGAEYFVVLEHLVTPIPSGDIAIGGIHIYVLDAKGKNAFSFLLNSHHKIFAEAKLRSADSSKKGQDTLVLNGTKAALSALQQQVRAAKVPGDVLDRFIGTWRTEYTIAKSEWTPREETGVADLGYRRVLGGHFVKEEGNDADAKTRWTMYTYDTEREYYRAWSFSSDGKTSEIKGEWDPKSKTLTWISIGGAEQNFARTSSHRFIDENTIEWKMTAKESGGKILFRAEGKATRVNDSKK